NSNNSSTVAVNYGSYTTSNGYKLSSNGFITDSQGRLLTIGGYYINQNGYLVNNNGTLATSGGNFITANGYLVNASGVIVGNAPAVNTNSNNTTSSNTIAVNFGNYTTTAGYNISCNGYITDTQGRYLTIAGYYISSTGYLANPNGTLATQNGNYITATGYLVDQNGRQVGQADINALKSTSPTTSANVGDGDFLTDTQIAQNNQTNNNRVGKVTQDTDKTQSDEIFEDVSAAAAEASDETPIDEGSPAETEAPVSEDEAVTADETAVSEDEAAVEETTVAETTVAETTAETVEETAVTEDEHDHDHADDFSAASEYTGNKQVVEKDGTSPNEKIVSKAFELKTGEAGIVESADGEHYYIVIRLDLGEDDSYFQSAKDSLLFEMKEEDYDALVDTWVNAQNVIPNEQARKRYDPTKIFKEE
ncbi:MAG: hypothetical protein IKR73_08280, partial [Oscillospiraceae bacterium]|nr:hypothetical protein [Oscillospiraceae bacterium]